MPSKKEKQQQQALLAMKTQTTPLANSTNIKQTGSSTIPLANSYHKVTTTTTTLKSKTNLNFDSFSNDPEHMSLVRDQKEELDGLNFRFSNYVLALQKKSKENNDLQKKVDLEKQKQKNLARQDFSDLESQMNELRSEIDESAVTTEHLFLKRNSALKELASLKDKIRQEEDQSYASRRHALETEHQQTVLQLKELSRRYADLEKLRKENQDEMKDLSDLYKKLEEELHDLVVNNIRLQCNLRTIEEQTLLTKAIYETEKADLANEQIKQKQLYTNELDKAISDIKQDFQSILKTNKRMLENAYTERIEQVKTQITSYEQRRDEIASITPKISIETLHKELKEVEKLRDDTENEYRPLVELFVSKQKEKANLDEERMRLDLEYNRLLSEINQLTEEIELGKRFWFSVHFEVDTYRRLLDIQTGNPIFVNHTNLANGEEEEEEFRSMDDIRLISEKKVDHQSQRAISKTGKFDIDQVQAGFISINNAATNCVDQPLKGWSLVRTVNESNENTYQFPDNCVLKAKTRVRVYSSKVDNPVTNSLAGIRLIATSIPAWASTGQGENVKIVLLDEKGINRAQYTETWQ